MSDWLTYAQAAERFGLSAEAVRQLAIRHRWPRRRPNADPHGKVEVGIPSDFEIRPRPTVRHPDRRPSNGLDEHLSNDRPTPVLYGHPLIVRERERADRAEQRADEATRRADAAIALADRTLAQLADATARADAAESERREVERRVEWLEGERDQQRDRADNLHKGLAAAETSDDGPPDSRRGCGGRRRRRRRAGRGPGAAPDH